MEVLQLTDTRTRQAINKNNKRAFDLFTSKQYVKAFRLFSHNLTLDSDNLESTIGVLLSDMAQDFEEQATGIYEYYQILLTQEISKRNAQKQILETIKGFDQSTNKIFDMLKTLENLRAESIDGILYQDFKKIALEKLSFKEAFEDLMYSTKIIFTNKHDFYEFLHELVDNNYQEISMDYIESIRRNVAYDGELEQILEKVVNDYRKKHKL